VFERGTWNTLTPLRRVSPESAVNPFKFRAARLRRGLILLVAAAMSGK
jgi:hypothetical protein